MYTLYIANVHSKHASSQLLLYFKQLEIHHNLYSAYNIISCSAHFLHGTDVLRPYSGHV